MPRKTATAGPAATVVETSDENGDVIGTATAVVENGETADRPARRMTATSSRTGSTLNTTFKLDGKPFKVPASLSPEEAEAFARKLKADQDERAAKKAEKEAEKATAKAAAKAERRPPQADAPAAPKGGWTFLGSYEASLAKKIEKGTKRQRVITALATDEVHEIVTGIAAMSRADMAAALGALHAAMNANYAHVA